MKPPTSDTNQALLVAGLDGMVTREMSLRSVRALFMRDAQKAAYLAVLNITDYSVHPIAHALRYTRHWVVERR